MNLAYFQTLEFLPAIKTLLKDLEVPFNPLADEPIAAQEILKTTYKDNASFQLMREVYFVGMVDDAAFVNNPSLPPEKIKSDYDGILFFGVTLQPREKYRLPTRGQLAEIARAFNREFYYTPVVVVFKYQNDQKEYIAFANTERLPYKQEWREGEKAGKVSLLRDIAIDAPHRGHVDIISQLQVPTSGRKAITNFHGLYEYWQEVFSVSVLNKKFYQELSNWYFWAIKHVAFPNAPTPADAHKKGVKLEDLIQEHKATNVIRLLTRLLFTWFIKEKGLIPEELFDLNSLQKDILKEISPHHEEGLFKKANEESVYYKAILQNLFFATLNCPIEPDGEDNRERGFRGLESYGKHRGVDYLMRYEKYFQHPEAFLKLVNSKVPFLNGGLFECLDEKDQGILIDGFSDNEAAQRQVVVPDFLFFGVNEEVDLSQDYGQKSKQYRQAAVKGLINLLESYKFTVTENTPIEEDVALDPELLGKVFENLLASYNPETKSTARKQTGSFYTPREIVNYMVDESLIAYLKNAVPDWDMEEDKLDKALHQLASFDAGNPFDDQPERSRAIIAALDRGKILDPACGSGAFPMGILQKMVHMLQKLDPANTVWKEIQKAKAQQAASAAFEMEDREERNARLREIEEAFDQSINDPDYARKLYLIENCIYGVDIQPIATQISKLRFFISLVVDQKVNADQPNFGIRALPNLETKFVTANTLVGIDRPDQQLQIFADDPELKQLEKQLKVVRNKLFSARTKRTKNRYRTEDERLRQAISDKLQQSGWPAHTAQQLANWDPYDQNASSPFFDPEWMFDVKAGFDVVIGNPPYVFGGSEKISKQEKEYFKEKYFSGNKKINLFSIFIEKGTSLLKEERILSYIIPNTFLRVTSYSNVREFVYKNTNIDEINDLDIGIFEGVTASTIIVRLRKSKKRKNLVVIKKGVGQDVYQNVLQAEYGNHGYIFDIFTKKEDRLILGKMQEGGMLLGSLARIIRFGVVITKNFDEVVSTSKESKNHRPFLEGDELAPYRILYKGRYLLYRKELLHRSRTVDVFEKDKIMIQRITGGSNPIKAVFDDSCFYNKESIINLQLKDPSNDSYFSLLAILNSCLINWFYKQKFTNNSKLTVNLSKEYLSQIPIKTASEQLRSLFSQASQMMSHSHISVKNKGTLLSVIDGLVFNLYFHEHMQEREIDVIDYIERDMELALRGRNFEALSDAEKNAVVEQLHATWTHPDNEVRNRMKLFAVRSPEILKPILES